MHHGRPLLQLEFLFAQNFAAPVDARHEDCCSFSGLMLFFWVSRHTLQNATAECKVTFKTPSLRHRFAIRRHPTSRKANNCIGRSSEVSSNKVLSCQHFLHSSFLSSTIWSMQLSAASLLFIFQVVMFKSRDIASGTVVADR